MIYSVLTALAMFLLTGELWAGVAGFFAGIVATRYLRSRVGEIIEKRGGVADARVIKQVCYNNDGERALPEDKEYTVLVRYRNGERFKYTLRGDAVLFNKLRPYISN
ncbi:MAG: hypothetical protein E7597_01220 [Ruminococcaceae bacterium]|nr:hypothetical protein [Oscillospiraceae bacterium]